jgi:hypothetical protein
VQFTELLAKTARHADKLAVVRSMMHTISGHPEGTAYLLQGAKPGGPIDVPDIGSTVAHLIGTPAAQLPPYVMIPGNGEQSYNTKHGFLSPGLKVFKTGGQDLSDPKWRVNDLRLLDGIMRNASATGASVEQSGYRSAPSGPSNSTRAMETSTAAFHAANPDAGGFDLSRARRTAR